jgi:SAM-dependent methyltransferase
VQGDDGYFDERVATRYDESAAEMFDSAIVDPVIDFLVELAGSGRALELGIGTGRIALPLAQRGVPVHGIELSKAMVARLRAKPGGEDIGVTIGDFATTTVDGTFAVAYLVFNTIMNLTTQAAQVACFRNVAAQLEPGGCFVIEVGVPGLQRLPPGETIQAFHVSETRWGLDEYDVARQGLTSHHFEIVDGRLERFSAPFRYAWPSELDLMAELAGMRLSERWSGWKREPFTSDSRRHVSVWEKPAF